MGLFRVARYVRFSFVSGLLLPLMLSAKVLVTVDGYVVTDSVLNELKQQNPDFNFDTLPQQQKTAILNEIIQQVLAANAAKKANLDKTEEYKMLEMGMLGRLWLQSELKSTDKQTDVSDSEVKDFYNSNKSKFVEQKASFSHILVSKEAEAKSVISELAKTPKAKVQAKFTELANKMSEDKGTAQAGGKLDNVNINELVPEFADGVRKLKPGSYTREPVKTAYGYHVILLDSISPQAEMGYDTVKGQIRQGLKQQKQQQMIQDRLRVMRDNAKITYGG